MKKRKNQRIKRTLKNKQVITNLRQVENLENTIQELEVKLKDIDIEMNNKGSEYEKLLELVKEKQRIQEELDLIIEKWMDIENSQ